MDGSGARVAKLELTGSGSDPYLRIGSDQQDKRSMATNFTEIYYSDDQTDHFENPDPNPTGFTKIKFDQI